MPKGHPLSRADHGRIQELRQQGLSVVAIATTVGCSPRTAYQLLEDARIAPGRVRELRALVRNLSAGGEGIVPERHALPKALIVNRYLAEESIRSLAQSFRVAPGRIRQLLEDSGVTIRANRHCLPRAPQPWTPQEIARCVRLRAQGHDMATIGLMVNRSRLAVASQLQEQARPTQAARMAARARRRRGDLLAAELPPEQVIEAVRRGWLEGRSIAVLARELQIPSAIVSGLLKRLGISVPAGGPNPNRSSLQGAANAIPTL
jgi:hypothetical protein